MEVKYLKRSVWQRLFGIPATSKVSSGSDWEMNNDLLTIKLDAFDTLATPYGALSFENDSNRVLVIADEDGGFRAYRNYCTHGKRRLDPVPGTTTVQCCSMGRNTFDSDGNSLNKPELGTIKVYNTENKDNLLKVFLS